MSKQRLIFIVDDDVLYSEMLTDNLSSDPRNRVVAYRTGEDCLQHLHEDPAFIILDYNLNLVEKDAKNGLEILEQVRKRSPHTKVVMLSSQERYGVALQTITKGAEQYVVKDKTAFDKINDLLNG